MRRRDFTWAALGLAAASVFMKTAEAGIASGVVVNRSDYDMAETINRIVRDITAKKIRLFSVIDQAALATEAGVTLNASTLIVFGNPPLGTQFLTANAQSGLDWPVRLLVYQDDRGQVWTAYTDFGWIARRHGIRNRKAQFRMASEVVRSIVSRTQAPKS